MNIMLVNVAERTREIGLRKALGATRADIVWQFLIESVIMGFIGGVIGVIAGIGLAFGISLYLTFDPIITWQMPLIALGISAATGLVFGLYPAYRASGKDPIESLRNSH
jgi:ABC-type antimicrobial peptide transport system permease subunit